ncbi:helix-turn-helix transcriptional regulator [Paenibacillus mesophilus]|uniref:helix-turn-helix domain-containing protein n=1 Tax=Paenibacillus mesophilus TaxID=2582849 RepID=UPI00110DFD15|nr:helix-turn-helix transcriptional regulator [Paenibacillus mesophilus]TMV45095.1 helix-turn-helix transcriptional regulator [Paenibacillus mesophilus]
MMANEALRFIGAKVRDIRKAKKLTQEQLADLAETHHSYIGAVERGERNVTIQSLEKIAVALDVDLYEFFEYGKQFSAPGSKNETLREIIVLLLDLTDQDLKKTYNILVEINKK